MKKHGAPRKCVLLPLKTTTLSKCDQCIVRQLSALKALGKDELLRISDCKTAQVVRKGESLFEEGQKVNGIFCIRDGACKLTKIADNGKIQVLRLAKKGELLGQRAMISGEVANLGATAIADMQVCFIPKRDILGLAGENANFTLEIMKNLCGELKDADDLLVERTQTTARHRLAHVLLDLESAFGSDSEGAIQVNLSREEIAGLAGTVTESGIRLLSEFNKLGLIVLSGKKIKIVGREQLRTMK